MFPKELLPPASGQESKSAGINSDSHSPCAPLPPEFFSARLLFYPEDGGSCFPRNTSTYQITTRRQITDESKLRGYRRCCKIYVLGRFEISILRRYHYKCRSLYLTFKVHWLANVNICFNIKTSDSSLYFHEQH